VSLVGEGWAHKMNKLSDFYCEEAKKRNIDIYRVPRPTIEGKIGLHNIGGDHPVFEFIFDDEIVSLIAFFPFMSFLEIFHCQTSHHSQFGTW
jgi:hypothetical protein